MSIEIDLSGRVALVTGGSRSLGAGIAKRLAADGAAVALTYSASPGKADDVVRAIETTGGRALAIRADASDAAAVKAAVTATVETFGRLDILVNNAGLGPSNLAEDVTEDDFDLTIDINVKGVFFASQIGYFNPDNFILNNSILVVAYVVFGGMGSLPGAMAGAAILTWLPWFLQDQVPGPDRQMWVGALLVLMMIFRPAGLFPARRRKAELTGVGMERAPEVEREAVPVGEGL
jgi:hypothetical protein